MFTRVRGFGSWPSPEAMRASTASTWMTGRIRIRSSSSWRCRSALPPKPQHPPATHASTKQGGHCCHLLWEMVRLPRSEGLLLRGSPIFTQKVAKEKPATKSAWGNKPLLRPYCLLATSGLPFQSSPHGQRCALDWVKMYGPLKSDWFPVGGMPLLS